MTPGTNNTLSSTPSPATRRVSKTAAKAAAVSSADILLLTAQRLFAERGISAVSLREIAREAGQKNTAASHYHFGSKEGLVQAILQQRMKELDFVRNEYLDRVLVQGRHQELRATVEAIVWPMAQGLVTGQLSTYNRFLAAAQMDPHIDLAKSTNEEGERGFRRVFELLQQQLPHLPEQLLRQRYLAGVAYTMFSLADFERIQTRRNKKQRSFDMLRAIENLIDMLCGALSAPVSSQVRARIAALAITPP